MTFLFNTLAQEKVHRISLTLNGNVSSDWKRRRTLTCVRDDKLYDAQYMFCQGGDKKKTKGNDCKTGHTRSCCQQQSIN